MVATPDTSDATRTHLNTLQHELLGDAKRAMSGKIQAVIKYCEFYGIINTIGMGTTSAWQAINKALGAIGLIVSANLVGVVSENGK